MHAQIFKRSLSPMAYLDIHLLDVEQAWTSVFYLKSFDMDSVQVGKAVFGKEIFTTLGIEPRTYSYPGRSGNPCSVCWVKKVLDGGS